MNIPERANSHEGAREAVKPDAENASMEAMIDYMSNYRSLTDSLREYGDSTNPRIQEIAQKYTQKLNTQVNDPRNEPVLNKRALQNNNKLISAIFVEFGKEVRAASNK